MANKPLLWKFLLILAVVFGVLSFFASRLLAPRRPSTAKEAPYECGIVPSREPPERFPVSFYIVAMLFIMFDIEIIFLFPYAVEAGARGQFGFWAIALFSVIFFLTFVYEVARGGLDWGPLQRARDLAAATGGAFDPTVLPLVELWGFRGGEPRTPSAAEVAAVLERVRWQELDADAGELEAQDKV